MKKHLYLFCCLVLFPWQSFAQQGLNYTEKSKMVQASYAVELGEAVQKAAESFAAAQNVELLQVQKNFIHLKVIYNEELSTSKRIAYCVYLLELFGTEPSVLDLKLVEAQKLYLEKSKNTEND